MNNLDKEWRNYQAQSQYAQNLQRNEVGILRDAKSGADFSNYVKNQIRDAPDKGVCATNIARELSKDNRYIINAATDLDGRVGLRYLQPHLDKSGEGKTLSDGIDKALKLWDKGAAEAAKQVYDRNEKNFKDNFSNFEQELKKQLDSQGIKVEKAYYKNFTGNQVEIRAEVRNFLKGVTAETAKGEKNRIYTGNSDIRIGGYDYRLGNFVPKETLDKHGTAEKSAIQPDDLLLILLAAKKAGELVVRQLGKGLTREAVDLTKAIGKDALKVGTKEGSKDSERALAKKLTDAKKSGEAFQDTVEDVTKTLKREKPSAREGSGEVPKRGDTQQDVGDTLESPKLESKVPSGEAPVNRLSATKAPSPYSEMDISTIGEDAARKARELGISRQEMSAYLDDKVWKAGHIDDQARFVSGLAGEEAKKVAREEINNIHPLGRDTTRKLMDYGYSPTNLSDAMKAGKENGKTVDQIRQGLNNELKLMDYLKNRFSGNDMKQVRAELKVAEDPRVAIKNNIQNKLWDEWKRTTPRSDELPTKMRSEKLGELGDKAAEMTKKIEKRLLGKNPTPAIIPPASAAILKGSEKDEDSKKKEKEKTKEEKNMEFGRGRGDSKRDQQRTASKDTNVAGGKQKDGQQKVAKKEKDERELKKAAEREKVGSVPKESSKKEGGGGSSESKEVKKDAPASDSRTYPK